MSATRGVTSPCRQPLDFYETPAWAVRAILPVLKEVMPYPVSILEPGAGSGAITSLLRGNYPDAHLVVNEIDPRHRLSLETWATRVRIGNYLDTPIYSYDRRGFDLVIGNPPYTGPKREDLALRFTMKALGEGHVVCFLLRLNWLGSQRRASWMRKHTPYVCLLPKRPSFLPNEKGRSRTDSCEYAWMIWTDDEKHAGRIRVLEVE